MSQFVTICYLVSSFVSQFFFYLEIMKDFIEDSKHYYEDKNHHKRIIMTI